MKKIKPLLLDNTPYVFMGITLIVLALNIYFLQQPKKRQTESDNVNTSAKIVNLYKGTTLPEIKGVDEKGNSTVLNFTNRSSESLLFVFLPGCSICDMNWSSWNKLSEEDIDTFYVSLVGQHTTDFLKNNKVNSKQSSIVLIDPKDSIQNGLNIAPITILVDNRGAIKEFWTGALSEQDLLVIRQSILRK